MSKKREKTLAEIVEQCVRDALHNCKELQDQTKHSELAYCEAVDEGLDLIREGNSMRLQELQSEENDE